MSCLRCLRLVDLEKEGLVWTSSSSKPNIPRDFEADATFAALSASSMNIVSPSKGRRMASSWECACRWGWAQPLQAPALAALTERNGGRLDQGRLAYPAAAAAVGSLTAVAPSSTCDDVRPSMAPGHPHPDQAVGCRPLATIALPANSRRLRTCSRHPEPRIAVP